jgi:hypothetical protein
MTEESPNGRRPARQAAHVADEIQANHLTSPLFLRRFWQAARVIVFHPETVQGLRLRFKCSMAGSIFTGANGFIYIELPSSESKRGKSAGSAADQAGRILALT